MKLMRLRIANCSRIADVDVEVRDNMVLIGPNGSGKTTVLLCLDMLLGMDDRQLRATLSREFIRDESRPMTVEAEFANMNEREQAQFANGVDVSKETALAVRLDVISNGDDVDVVRDYSGFDLRKSSPQTQANIFGWTAVPSARMTTISSGSNDPAMVGEWVTRIFCPSAALSVFARLLWLEGCKCASGSSIARMPAPT